MASLAGTGLFAQDELNQFPREPATDSAALILREADADGDEGRNPLGRPLDYSARLIPGDSES